MLPKHNVKRAFIDFSRIMIRIEIKQQYKIQELFLHKNSETENLINFLPHLTTVKYKLTGTGKNILCNTSYYRQHTYKPT